MKFIFYFGMLFMFACQHNPSNVQIVYKNANGVGYQNSGFKLLDEEDSKSYKREEYSPTQKKSTPDLKPLDITEDADIVEEVKEQPIKPKEINREDASNIVSSNVVSSNELDGKYHVVQKGETYYSISRLYFIEPKNLMAWNNAKPEDKLLPATIIRLYSGKDEYNAPVVVTPSAKPLEIKPTNSNASDVKVTSAKNLEIKKDSSMQVVTSEQVKQPAKPQPTFIDSGKCSEKFIMPVSDLKIITHFGDAYKGGVKSDGIIFESKVAENVKASNSGEVAYVGDGFSDYGNIIIIRHSNSYFSIYGHLSNILVKRGQVVKKGDVISSTNQIERKFYFSIRKGKTPINPMICIK